ncbi:hypothetical protein BH20ACT23_BH20ACT23_25180 [soil metagenome]
MTSDERGQALIESVLLGLLLMIPIVWALMVLAEVHRAALASTSAAREAGFDAARSHDMMAAERSVERAVDLALANHGLEADDSNVSWSAPDGLERGARVEVQVAYPVGVVSFPFLGEVSGPSVWVRSTHVARVDPFASR